MTRFAIVVLLVLGAALIGCKQKASDQSRLEQVPPELMQGQAATSPNAAAGVTWSVPSHWVVAPPRQMRVATYTIPAAGGDEEPAECGVFFFGNDQGGSVDANIERWVQQFEPISAPVRSTRDVNGIQVVLVQIAGAYLAPSGPMMQSQGKKPNFKLLGAIVQAPGGSVFFKLTGPEKTVAACEGDFNNLISSLKKP